MMTDDAGQLINSAGPGWLPTNKELDDGNSKMAADKAVDLDSSG